MRTLFVTLAACLLLLGTAPAAEAAPEPVGGCGSDATVEVCAVQCIQPPCPVYVCIKGDTVCRWI